MLFWSLDRFSREGVPETLTCLQNLTQYGVGYRSFTEQYLDSCGMFLEAVISILAVIAKQERVRHDSGLLPGNAPASRGLSRPGFWIPVAMPTSGSESFSEYRSIDVAPASHFYVAFATLICCNSNIGG